MDTTDPAPPKPQRRTCLTCFIVLAIIVVFPPLLLLGWMTLIHRVIPAPPLVISEETTRITGPLTADGYIDFFKALEQKISPPELATDENGYRVFVRLFGDVDEYDKADEKDREFYRLQKCEKLGLDPNIPPTLVFPDCPDKILADFCRAKGEAEPRLTVFDRPWTLDEHPMLADWISKIDETTDAIAEVIRKPIFSFPLLQNRVSVESGKPQVFISVEPNVPLVRKIARIFRTRATYRIGQGDIDGAIDDKLTLHRFGRLLSQKSPTRLYLIGYSIEEVAEVIPVGANPEYPLTEQQIRRILAGLDALPPRTPFAEILEWERYNGLSFVQNFDVEVHQGNKSPSEWFQAVGWNYNVLWRLFCANPHSIDWNIIYLRINEMYDAIQESPPRTKLAAIEDEINNPSGWQFLSRLLTPGGKNMLIANQFAALLWFPIDHLETGLQCSECWGNMQRLTLAILLYQLEHGEMPNENWATQIEKYLGENPEQYFSCPKNPSPKGETMYAMLRYDDVFPDTIADALDTLLLVELAESVPFAEATMTVDEFIEFVCDRTIETTEYQCCGRTNTSDRVISSRFNAHSGGANVAHRNGQMRFLSNEIEKAELLRMLGRKEEREEE